MKSVLIGSALHLAAALSLAATPRNAISATGRRVHGAPRAFEASYQRRLGGNRKLPRAMQDRIISSAEERQARRGVKRQRDYDRCINGNPLFSGPFQYVLTPPTEEPPRNSIAVAMRYCGDKKKLAGKIALVRPAVGITPSGKAVRAQFDDLELTWRGIHLSQGWHVFDETEFEAI